jgi:hypothetical protein
MASTMFLAPNLPGNFQKNPCSRLHSSIKTYLIQTSCSFTENVACSGHLDTRRKYECTIHVLYPGMKESGLPNQNIKGGEGGLCQKYC